MKILTEELYSKLTEIDKHQAPGSLDPTLFPSVSCCPPLMVVLFRVYREKMAQAYDFALDKMGMDIMSFSIWSDYINFLKSV